MTQPTWTTPAGKLASVNERESYTKTLQAAVEGQVPGAFATSIGRLKYTLIAGELPPGLHLATNGIIDGVPFEVANRKKDTIFGILGDGGILKACAFAFSSIFPLYSITFKSAFIPFTIISFNNS